MRLQRHGSVDPCSDSTLGLASRPRPIFTNESQLEELYTKLAMAEIHQHMTTPNEGEFNVKKRSIARGIGLAVALGTSLLLNIGSASAATVNWKEVNTNSNWHCTGWNIHEAVSSHDEGYYYFKTCIVTNSSGGAQAVAVVQNNGIYSNMPVKAAIRFPAYDAAGQTLCTESQINPGYTRGCFAPTRTERCITPAAEVLLYVKRGGVWHEDTDYNNGVVTSC
ncbi:hypothetical protein ACFU7X_44890 [Streptomyces chartreusis]|uniref:hypothetical protein n=1 Tax=Streptomyces chartreusis TaxID=1969 RepID=UPI0036AFB0BB